MRKERKWLLYLRSRITWLMTSLICVAFLVSLTSDQRVSLANQTVSSNPIKLHKFDREPLIRARAEGKSEVMICVASLPGTNESLVRKASALGASVRYQDNDIDYVRLKLPIDRVEELAQLKEIQAIHVLRSYAFMGEGNIFPLFAPSQMLKGQEESALQKKITPPGQETSPENPYFPTRDIGAPQFIAKHPTFDGRGVTICILEGPGDLLVPELQNPAITLDGKPTRKVVGVLYTRDPEEKGVWRVPMTSQVTTDAGHFVYQDTEYKAPAEGVYRMGGYDYTAFMQKVKDYVDLDGILSGTKGKYAVLWNETTNTVWVDTNLNQDFSDEQALTDYNVRYDIGIFGKDNPTTPVRETIGFIVFPDVKHKCIDIIPLVSAHATATATIAAGRGFFGGKMDSPAPGARIIFVRSGVGMDGRIEGLISAIKDPRIDIISTQSAVDKLLTDGNSVLSIIYKRLITRYKKPTFASHGNEGPGMNTTNENSAGNNVICVGGYMHGDTWQVNTGLLADQDDYVYVLSSRGPRHDGGFKPDIITPAFMMLNMSPFYEYSRMMGSNPPYALPPGYAIAGGTSAAAPMAAGGAALLISAAKQSGVPYDAERIKWAIKSSARFLPEFGAHEQGSGLFQVEAAWEALKSAPPSVAIRSQALVKTVSSKFLEKTDQGAEIFEREAWVAGKSDQRTISFIRTTGTQQLIPYCVSWGSVTLTPSAVPQRSACL